MLEVDLSHESSVIVVKDSEGIKEVEIRSLGEVDLGCFDVSLKINLLLKG